MKLYQHYKGGLYVMVDNNADDSTNAEQGRHRTLVVYYSVATGMYHVRDRDEFFENVDGIPRFREVKTPGEIQ